jgi:hypothetical protein
VRNNFDETVDHVRAIVERIEVVDRNEEIVDTPERRLRLSDDRKGSTSVLSARSAVQFRREVSARLVRRPTRWTSK